MQERKHSSHRVFMGRSVVGVSQQVVIIQGRKDNSVQYLKLKIAYLPWHER